MRDRDIEENPWETEINIPLNIELEFILKIDTREEFRCKIEEKAIIFFKSKYRKHELKATIIPTKVKETINEDNNRIDKKKELITNLIKPQILNFDSIAANNNGIEVLASQWTSGNQ